MTKVSELEAGQQTDALVALAQGWEILEAPSDGEPVWAHFEKGYEIYITYVEGYQPSTNGSQAFGLILSGIAVEGDSAWSWKDGICIGHIGATPNEAICKVRIGLKWGDTIPDEIWRKVL